MDEFEDAASNIGQGIRNLRDLIDAERERQENASNDAGMPGESTRDDERQGNRR